MNSVIKSVAFNDRPVMLGARLREPVPATQKSTTAPPLEQPIEQATQAYPEREIAREDPSVLAERLFASRLESAVTGKLAELQDKHARQAQERFAQASQEGYQKGFQEGVVKAEKDASAQRKTLQGQFDTLCATIKKEAHSALTETEDFVCQLTFEALRKIIGDAACSGELIAAVVQENMKHIKDSTECVLTVHPDDAKILQALYDTDTVQPQIEVDASMARGGCRIQSVRGTVDATLETQLAAFLRALRGHSPGQAFAEAHPLHDVDVSEQELSS